MCLFSIQGKYNYMSYQALYRKYRPGDFSEIVGQPVLIQTLKNAVTSGHISHAYLFSGPRGTGKTTTARVFAKAINCHFTKNGEPCNQCKTCCGINKSTLADYVEIDAASNNGVDEIRNIRSQIKYAPLIADYKIYVIDEVHMLSLGAFNALLKTLEEPPSYAIFILATTNPQKIPATIISRLQKFDFHRFHNREITDQLAVILKHEKVDYEISALELISRLANGGMRDALSILDQAVTLGNDKITLELVNNLTGTTKKELLFEYLEAISTGDVEKSTQEIDQIIDEGKDLIQFIHDLVLLIKDLLLLKNRINPTTFLASELKRLPDLSTDWLFKVLAILSEQSERLRQSVYPDLIVEIMTIELADLKEEQGARDKVTATNAQSIGVETQPQVKVQEAPVSFAPIKQQEEPQNDGLTNSEFISHELMHQVLNSATRKDLDELTAKWKNLIENSQGELTALIKYTHPVAASSNGVIIAFKFETFLQKINHSRELQKDLKKLIGEKQIYGISDEEWPEYRKEYLFLRRKNQMGTTKAKVETQSQAEMIDQKQIEGLTSNMEAIIKFLGPENVKIIDD